MAQKNSAAANEDVIERLAKRVHGAWWEEKKRHGFHHPDECPHIRLGAPPGPGALNCPQCHNDMRPYDELREAVKELSRVMVRSFIGHLAEEGYFVVISAPMAIPQPLFEDYCRYAVTDPAMGYKDVGEALKDEGLREVFEDMMIDWDLVGHFGDDSGDIEFIAWWARQCLRIKAEEMK